MANPFFDPAKQAQEAMRRQREILHRQQETARLQREAQQRQNEINRQNQLNRQIRDNQQRQLKRRQQELGHRLAKAPSQLQSTLSQKPDGSSAPVNEGSGGMHVIGKLVFLLIAAMAVLFFLSARHHH